MVNKYIEAAPWCNLCKTIAPEFENVSKYLKGMIKVGVINSDTERKLISDYRIDGFPTILFFGPEKDKPLKFQGDLGAKNLAKWTFNQGKRHIFDRMEGNLENEEDSNQSEVENNTESQEEQHNDENSAETNESNEKKSGNTFTDKYVEVLNERNFDEIVLNSKHLWYIDFYAPWCGHCQSLEPEWNQASTELKGRVRFGKVDATENQELSRRFRIEGFPTILISPPSEERDDSSFIKYEGSREAHHLVFDAQDRLERLGIVPEPEQLYSHEQFNDLCIERNGLCVIAFLPHIYDSTAEQRRTYIKMLSDSVKFGKGKSFIFFWCQGGDFLKFEENLGINFGYPAVVLIAFSKKKFTVMRNSFEQQNIKNFVSNSFYGKEIYHDLNTQTLPKLKDVGQWDGENHRYEDDHKIEKDEF